MASGQSVLQLRITLEDVRPVIWRRLLVPGGVRLNRLHDMFQVAMGWTDSHLHQFRIEEAQYGMHADDYPEDERDETEATVIGVLGEVRRFFYDYDFGDDWNHEVVVEEVAWGPWALKHAVAWTASGRVRPKMWAVRPAMASFWGCWPTLITRSMSTMWAGREAGSTPRSSVWRPPMWCCSGFGCAVNGAVLVVLSR